MKALGKYLWKDDDGLVYITLTPESVDMYFKANIEKFGTPCPFLDLMLKYELVGYTFKERNDKV